jgi:hypothetical protein
MNHPHPAADTTPAVDRMAVQAHLLFGNGPLLRMRSRLPMLRGKPFVLRRVLLFVLLAWAPLLVLASLYGNEGKPLLRDLGAFTRYVIAGPLLLAGEAVCLAVLGDIAQRMLDLLPTRDARARFAQVIQSVRDLLSRPLAEVAVVVGAFVLSAGAHQAVDFAKLPSWYLAAADAHALSPAGWWHALVSMPLLLMLMLAWLWRLIVWTRFLWLMTRLDLALVSVHPDRAAGLGFVGNSLLGFAPVAAALGCIVAGSVANKVIYGGASLAAQQDAAIAVALLSVALFTAPLLVCSARLIRLVRREAAQYDTLATAFGQQFEHEWFNPGQPVTDRSLLDRPDFSAAADLYALAERVRALRAVPVRWTHIVLLVAATLLPFLPVALAVVSFDAVIGALLSLLH